jgi:hypothetical protein
MKITDTFYLPIMLKIILALTNSAKLCNKFFEFSGYGSDGEKKGLSTVAFKGSNI